MYSDPFFMLLIPAFILAIYAQIRVRSVYAKYSQVSVSSNYTGAEAAREILTKNGLSNISVEEVSGNLTDHYDPIKKALRLSSGVYRSNSVAAVGIAAHESGHAIQHARMYMPIMIRSGIFPAANFGSKLAIPLFFLGIIFRFPALMDIGIIVFSAVVVFQVVTLPVEFNASSRALVLLSENRIVTASEADSAKAVLNAAALTYLAATAMAILNLLRLFMLRQNRR